MARPLFGSRGQEIPTIRINPARDSYLVTRARKMEEEFRRQTGSDGLIEHTNLRALHEIQKLAAKNLQESIAHNRRPDFGTGRLEKAILKDQYSNVTPTTVEFLVRSKIFPAVPYFASLEYGDRSQIGKERWFTFLGVRSDPEQPNFSIDHRRNFNRPHKPSDVRNNRRPGAPHTLHEDGDGPGLAAGRRSVTFSHPQGVTDRIIGPREYAARYGKANAFRTKGRVPVIIRRPVPQYAYGRKAGELFIKTLGYKKILDDESASFRKANGVGLER